MKIIRFEDANGGITWGKDHGSHVTRLHGLIFDSPEDTGETVEVSRLLAPVVPADIYCIGLNYVKHAEESGMTIPQNPCVFMKASSAVQAPDAPIELPRHLRSDAVDFECELAVVIGRRCKNVSKEQALDHVAGYTCANDVSTETGRSNGAKGSGVGGKRLTRLPLWAPAW